MGSSKKQTTGYWYYMGLHLGFCIGPIDAMHEIRMGGRSGWKGQRYTSTFNPLTGQTTYTPVSNSPVTVSEQIYISAEQLFGGHKREGGIAGFCDVMMGEPTQAPNDYLLSKIGAPQPAYRGIFGMVFRGGKVSANNPYLKAWEVQGTRILAGWDGDVWYSAKAAVDVGGGLLAMNPAHIIYQCLTDGEWGLGYPSGKLDLPSFVAAADQFHEEGFGLCMQWTRQESVQNFVQLIADHIGAAVGEDPRTGLFKLKAIRDDYDVDELPEFSAALGNIVSLDSFDRATQTEAINELTVTFTDAVTGKDSSTTLHRLANIVSQNTVVPQSRSYAALPTKSLADRVCQRDLRAGAAGIARVRFTATRAAYGLLPGDVIAFTWPELGIVKMPIRIGKVNYGNLTSGEIKIEAVEDVFGLDDTTYVGIPSIGWEEPDRTPVASTAVAAFEAPFRELVTQLGSADARALATDSGYVSTVARRPSGLSTDYELRTRISPADFEQVDDADWTPTATLAQVLGPTTTTVTIAGAVDLDLVDVGSAVLIGTGAGAEIARLDSVNYTTNTITLGRGCCDTVPAANWPIGTRLWFYDSFAAADSNEYVVGEVVDTKIITRTTGGELDESLAPGASVTLARRAARPYPPGDLKVNTSRYPAEAYGTLTATWVHRDRLLQQDTLIDHLQASIGPPVALLYTVRWYLDNVLSQTFVTAGLTDAYTPPVGSGGKTIRVEIESEQTSLLSWQRTTHTFPYRAQRISETGDRRVTEAGDVRILE